jgi:hypothetical protein
MSLIVLAAMSANRLRTLSATVLLTLVACNSTARVVINNDGGWCWFQDERALALGDTVLIGSVATGHTDASRKGNIELTRWQPSTGEIETVVLHERLQTDDHAAPALALTADGRLLTTYTKHGSDRLLRWRVFGQADHRLEPAPERRLDVGAPITYSNLFLLRSTNELVNLSRAKGWDPNLFVSTDDANTWTPHGRLLAGPGRPYVIYTSNGEDQVHLIATDQHPRDFDNSLYHGILQGRSLHDSQGRKLGTVGGSPPSPSDLTRIFAGKPDAVAWPADVELDEQHHPVVVFTIQRDGAGQPRGHGGMDHRFYYARFDGRNWHVQEIGHAGRRLYAGEDDYTGLAAIDPADPSTVYLSTDADPRTGKALISNADGQRHRELFAATTRDGGQNWQFQSLTAHSDRDNVRPIVPAGTPHVLLWLRGTMRTYTDYAFEVVGMRLP